MILLEAYTGKNSNMKKAEVSLSKFIDLLYEGYKGDDKHIINNFAPKLNNNKYIKDVEKHLNNEFKFNSLKIQFNILDPLSFNAGPHTIPSVFRFFRGNDIKEINKSLDVVVYMDIPFIVEHNLTTSEVMAIILHEIGHSLDLSAPSRFLAYFNAITTLGIFPLYVEGMRMLKTSINSIIDEIISVPIFRKSIVYYQHLLRDFYNLMRIDSTMKLPVYLFYGVLATLSGVHLNYYAERKSDSVAVQYGYGPELASGLNKLNQFTAQTNFEKIVRSNPVSGLLYDLNDAIMMIVGIILKPHPANINRAKNALYKLKADLRDPSIPSNLKKEIKKEIAQLEKIVEDMETPSFKQNEYRLFTALTNRIVGYGTGRNRNILDLFHSAENYES